jgi:uncharacterized protein YciI
VQTTWLRSVRITATVDDAREAVSGHLAQVERFREQGRLVWAAAFADDDGFVEAFRAEDRLEATALAEASPLIARGLAAWSLRRLAGDGGARPAGDDDGR